jgi:hypothetical protein
MAQRHTEELQRRKPFQKHLPLKVSVCLCVTSLCVSVLPLFTARVARDVESHVHSTH